MPSPKRPSSRTTEAVIQFGWTLLAGCLLLFFAGRWLDARWGTDPLLSIIGILLGVFVGLRSLFREVARQERAEKSRRATDDPPEARKPD